MSRLFKALAVGVMAASALMPLAVEATPYASSSLEVTGGTFSGAGFSSFNFVLNQTSASSFGATANSPGNVDSQTGGATLDQPISCLGVCGSFVENSFFPTPGVGAIGTYSIADSHMLNTAISLGTGNFGSRTQAQIAAGTGTGLAQTGTDNTLQWNFTLSETGTVGVSGNVTLNFHIHTDDFGELAGATGNFSVDILDIGGSVVVSLIDLTFSNTINTLAGAQDLFALDEVTNPFSGNVELAAGTYTLRINFDTSANVLQTNAVPEPMTLSLLGVGLVGAVYAARRRRS